jgi:hypothetical protein
MGHSASSSTMETPPLTTNFITSAARASRGSYVLDRHDVARLPLQLKACGMYTATLPLAHTQVGEVVLRDEADPFSMSVPFPSRTSTGRSNFRLLPTTASIRSLIAP